MADFVSGDTASTLLVTCLDETGAAINLTGSVKLRWKSAIGAVVEKTMTIVNAPLGICSYKFVTNELYAPGMAFEVEITDVGAFKLSNSDLITVEVRDQMA